MAGALLHQPLQSVDERLPGGLMPLTAETTRVRVNGVAIDPAAMPGAPEALPLSLGPCLTVCSVPQRLVQE